MIKSIETAIEIRQFGVSIIRSGRVKSGKVRSGKSIVIFIIFVNWGVTNAYAKGQTDGDAAYVYANPCRHPEQLLN